MKIARWLLVVALAGLAGSVAKADGIDPAIGVQGGSDQMLWTGSVMLTIGSNNCFDGTAFCSGAFFINTGTITNFDFAFDTEQGPFTALEGSAFPDITTIVPGFEALLSGGTIFPACFETCPTPTPTQIFGNFFFAFQGVTLGPNGTTTVTITSNVPEPGTITLMLVGLAALGLLLFVGGKVAQANSPAQIP